MTNDQLLAAWRRKLPSVEPTDRELTAFALGVEVAEASSERRAIMFGDLMHRQILAMRAAVVDGHLKSPEHGLQWIVNTLEGPGHLPDLDEARALGGAQALFDKEVAEQEAFRTAHPVPGAERFT
jgi:hypothetical protein